MISRALMEDYANSRSLAQEELREEKQVGGPVNCSDSELCTFLQGLEAGFLPTYYSDTSQSVQSKSMSIASRSYQHGKKTVVFHGFPSLQMSRSLTADLGEELLTSYLADSRVRHFPQLHAGEKPQLTCGLKCDGSLGKLNRPMCSPRTSQRPQLNKLQAIAPQWVIKPKCFPYQRQTWAQTTSDKGIGYLHTPTTKANYAAPSMQKWQVCRNFVSVFGKPTPENQEWLMAWPIGWSDTKPLAMDKFQRWQQQLCGHLQMLNSEGVCE